MRTRFLVLASTLLVAACQSTPSTGAAPATSATGVVGGSTAKAEGGATGNPYASDAVDKPNGAAKIIGTAKMEDNGTLVVTMYTQGDIEGQLQKRLTKAEPDYQKIIDHIGGMKPGEEKPLPAWPDDIDDDKVNAAVTKHIAEKSWAKGTRIHITGTDKDGNIAVTAIHPDARDEGLSLRLDPKTYAVVSQTKLNR